MCGYSPTLEDLYFQNQSRKRMDTVTYRVTVCVYVCLHVCERALGRKKHLYKEMTRTLAVTGVQRQMCILAHL